MPNVGGNVGVPRVATCREGWGAVAYTVHHILHCSNDVTIHPRAHKDIFNNFTQSANEVLFNLKSTDMTQPFKKQTKPKKPPLHHTQLPYHTIPHASEFGRVDHGSVCCRDYAKTETRRPKQASRACRRTNQNKQMRT